MIWLFKYECHLSVTYHAATLVCLYLSSIVWQMRRKISSYFASSSHNFPYVKMLTVVHLVFRLETACFRFLFNIIYLFTSLGGGSAYQQHMSSLFELSFLKKCWDDILWYVSLQKLVPSVFYYTVGIIEASCLLNLCD